MPWFWLVRLGPIVDFRPLICLKISNFKRENKAKYNKPKTCICNCSVIIYTWSSVQALIEYLKPINKKFWNRKIRKVTDHFSVVVL